MAVWVWVVVAAVAIGVVAALLGVDRYRGTHKTDSASSQPTNEVFTDPTTGKQMRVWYNPATGEREYRPE